MKAWHVVLVVIALLLSVMPAVAQTQHAMTSHWTDSTTKAANPTLTYALYRFTGKCPVGGGLPTGATVINPSPITTNSYTDTAVTAATTYCIFVTALLNGAESAPTNTSEGTIPVYGPTSITYAGRTVSWGASQDTVAGYNVWKGSGACSTNPALAKVSSSQTGLSYTDATALVGSTNCYAVTAVLNGLESLSTAISGTIPIAPATNVTITVQ